MSNEANAQENAAPEAAPATDNNPLEAELAKARDDMLRALAEVENTRRRAEKQTQEARTYAIDRFARDLLPVADTLGRALQSISPEARAALDEATRTLLDGVELTERALIDTFARHGLKRIGAKGEAFDPNLHQAVAQAPSEHPANTVIEVLQPGYVLGDRTVRAAMVMVSAGKAATAPEAGAGVDIKV
ncbi:MAG: nucleotide exchange factor GrpE [Hyphomonadaceae bacterium]|nr:nucleotide exchange factor GrpE [Hyphomonadaceae bacterium]